MTDAIRKFDCPGCHCNADLAPCDCCGGAGEIDDERLSPHFWLSELTTTSHLGVRNGPPPEAVTMLRMLCERLLEPIRCVFGPLHVTSGYRSRELDMVVAGPRVGISAHAIGAAADVIPMAHGVDTKKIMDYLAGVNRTIRFDQAILEGGCIHLAVLSPLKAQQRRQLLARVRGANYDKPGANAQRFAYETYDGSPGQMARIA